MRVPMKVDYGVRALVDLAQRYGDGSVQTVEIADRQSIPEPYPGTPAHHPWQVRVHPQPAGASGRPRAGQVPGRDKPRHGDGRSRGERGFPGLHRRAHRVYTVQQLRPAGRVAVRGRHRPQCAWLHHHCGPGQSAEAAPSARDVPDLARGRGQAPRTLRPAGYGLGGTRGFFIVN